MSEFVTVDIPQGRLRGKRVTSSSNGVTYYSFQGIPYAKPPVGPLRFKPPEDPGSWTGTRDATAEGAVAPQIDMFSKKFLGDEDCLFLNVYTQQLPTTLPKAVMVWIHGGNFIFGSGNAELYGPDFLVSEDIVLVTINYRLGALGFLYLDGADVTGNNGLRDQVKALKWVRNNISKFGGDPGNVTIFGESAGGVSVHFLMLSSLAAGLFHRAIAQSGTALISGCYTPHGIRSQRAVRLAKLLGCTSENPQEVADFLRTVAAEDLVAQQLQALLKEENDRLITLPYYPNEEIGEEALLPSSPRALLSHGRFAEVPFMTGVTSAEGKIMLLGLYLRKNLSELDKCFENLLPPELVPNTGSERRKEIANSIKKFYFGDRQLGDSTVTHYINLMSDLMFVYPMVKIVQSQIRWSLQPTYVYLFDHIHESKINVMTNKIDDVPGASHAAELPYLFHTSPRTLNFSPGSLDDQVRVKCVQLWTQFAKTGNPTRDEAKFTWTPATEEINYLKINNGFEMDSNMYKHRMDFLERLYNTILAS